ncbi:hypothetical protein GCM10009715_04420 [Paeniglutamicibacter psychrophenolicus]
MASAVRTAARRMARAIGEGGSWEGKLIMTPVFADPAPCASGRGPNPVPVMRYLRLSRAVPAGDPPPHGDV